MSEKAEFHWPLQVQEAMTEALTGCQESWATLYAAAAAFTREGAAIPAPLSTMMAERLQAIANVLTDPREKDKRAAYPDAILTAATRFQGRKGKTLPHQMAEEVLLLALCHALPSDLLAETADLLMALPEEALPMAARVTSTKDLDVAIAYLVDKKMTVIPENNLRADARKLRNILRKSG